MLELVTPAADRNLLGIEELRAAAGVTGTSQDIELLALGVRVSDMVAIECGVARAGIAAPTLLRETVRERVAPRGAESIYLSRRFVEVITVSEGGTDLPAAGFEADAVAGELRRPAGMVRCWGSPVVITYAAGFPPDQVPGPLKEAAIIAIREIRSAGSRDPLLRSETVEGIGRFDYQIGGSARPSGSVLPDAAVAILDAFRTISFA